MINNKIVFRYKGIELVELDIPSWQMDLVRDRLEDYKNHPDQAMDFDEALGEIESDI